MTSQLYNVNYAKTYKQVKQEYGTKFGEASFV